MRLLEELLEASGTDLTTEDYAREFLQNEIIESLGQPRARCSVMEILNGSYQLEPEDLPAMQAVADRWNVKKGASA